MWGGFAYTYGNCDSNGNVDAIWNTNSYSKCSTLADTNIDAV